MSVSLLHRFVAFTALAFVLAACSGTPSDEVTKNAGERVSILAFNNKKLSVDADIHNYDILYPEASKNESLEQAGGNAQHNFVNASLPKKLEVMWEASIGKGSSGDFKLLARPVVADHHVFTLDAEGVVTSFTTDEGEAVWRFDTTPADRDDPAMGGGLGFENCVLYVTTGFGEVLALDAKQGKVIWRKMINKPLRAAPTISERFVLVVTIDNELHALDTTSGDEIWHHSGISENATLMGASSPSVYQDNAIVAYNSGEVFCLRLQNGRVAWSDALAASTQVGALPSIADIRGQPVILDNKIYAISHSGRMAALDLRTGDRAWEADIGGVNSPVVGDNTVFVFTNDNILTALVRETGRVIWVQEMQKKVDPEDFGSAPVLWSGPVLAGSQLWMTNTLGHVSAFGPQTGVQLFYIDLSVPFYIPPVVADDTLFVINDKGSLIALH